ncbi:MAG: hypothetical protein IPJ00_17345 [Saprospirales bacterium]|nr:hypothetical protein [Saprospirales bacterium]
MKERPILFSGPMVRAILEGRKTMTRRVVKPQFRNSTEERFFREEQPTYLCPFGIPSQKLWVRETWLDDGETKDSPQWIYRADNENYPRNEGQNWKSSIFMPRAASRILLEVVSVRVERLQDITEEDAMAEGAELYDNHDGTFGGYGAPMTYRESFHLLWQSINGPDSWDQNPWVWVVEFRKIEQE